MAKRGARAFYVFICCLLTVPLCVYFIDGIEAESIKATVMAGTLLGAAHVVLRPVLRLLSAPLGCLTMGLSGMVIDVALIYGCDRLLDGFRVDGLLHMLLILGLFLELLTPFPGRGFQQAGNAPGHPAAKEGKGLLPGIGYFI